MISLVKEKLREQLRAHIQSIYRAGITAVAPDQAIHRQVHCDGSKLQAGEFLFDLSNSRVFLIAFGKAAVPMARALENILGDRIGDGLVVTKHGHRGSHSLKRVHIYEAGHPVPDHAGMEAAKQALKLAREASAGDLVLIAISGGGSALLPLPAEPVSLEEKQITTDLLLKSGATIEEINTIRKHLSQLKGGRLAAAISPATSCSLILSDVIGDPLEFIASGPTVPDSTTFEDAWAICKRYNLTDHLPASVTEYLNNGIAGTIEETPKPGNKIFKNAKHVIVGNIARALAASQDMAQKLGYQTAILTSVLKGEAREIAQIYPAMAHDILKHDWPFAPPACVLCGGEPTVTVTGTGTGGRNQELALAVLPALAGKEISVFAAVATDGTDGPTDAAGAVVDDVSLARAYTQKLDWQAYLQNNDAYTFFSQLGDLIKTGPTQTNVMDMHILLVQSC